MRDEMTRFQKHGVQPFGVNPAGVDGHRKYVEKFRFTFPLLSDPDRKVARAYRALKEGSDSIWRSVYLIGQDGRVWFAARGAPGADEILAPLGA